MVCFQICTSYGRGGANRENANFKTRHTEYLSSVYLDQAEQREREGGEAKCAKKEVPLPSLKQSSSFAGIERSRTDTAEAEFLISLRSLWSLERRLFVRRFGYRCELSQVIRVTRVIILTRFSFTDSFISK